MTKTSGTSPFRFFHRKDLHLLQDAVAEQEINLHTMFAVDKRDGYGHIYYAVQDVGIVRISPELNDVHHIIPITAPYKSMNFHSCKLEYIDGELRLILTANDEEMVCVFDLDGQLDFSLNRPTLDPYNSPENGNLVDYKPTDTIIIDNKLYIADGYAANYISVYDLDTKDWAFAFGGKTDKHNENGKFRTAHAITRTPDSQHLLIVDRWNSRLQIHESSGDFVRSHHLPYNAWLCSIDFVNWNGRKLGLIACLYDVDEDKKNPAPIYVVDADTFEILSTIHPKSELDIELAQRIHNAIWHIHSNELYIIAHSWNPGHFFVLQHVMT